MAEPAPTAPVTGLLANLSIGRKIVGLSVIVLSLMLAAAIYAFIQTSRAHAASDDLVSSLEPLSDRLAMIEGHTLEEALLVERALRHGGPQLRDAAKGASEFARFRALSGEVSRRIDEAGRMIRAAAARATRIDDAVAIGGLEPQLDEVRREHQRYDAAGIALFGLEHAPPPLIKTREQAFATEEDRLAGALDRVTARIEQLSRVQGGRVESLEDRAFLVSTENLAVAIVAFLAGTLLSSMVTRRMLRPVHKLIAGADEIGRGNLDVRFEIAARDEIGRLSAAFETMVGELRSKAAIRETFGSYVDRRVVDRLLGEGREAIEAGERRDMTVFFADLQGFSGIAESLTPSALVKLINSYLTLASEPIAEHQGIIDKYIGDAVMAFWGPPFTEGDYTLAACLAALAQADKLQELRRLLPELLGLRKGIPEINARIGLSTGEVVVGSIGAKFSKSFTVIGDTVNTASRLEGANKHYGTWILADEATASRVRGTIETREIDLLGVVGKDDPIRIFELLGRKGEVAAARIASRDCFERGLGAYRAREWDTAAKLFGEAAVIMPGDRPSAVFLARVATFQTDPPPPDWEAVWRITDK